MSHLIPDGSSLSSGTGGRDAVVEIAMSARATELRRMAMIDYKSKGMRFRARTTRHWGRSECESDHDACCSSFQVHS